MTKIFLSYARGDDGEPYEPSKSFVARLHTDLTAAGFDVWFDRVSMPSRQLTFHQEIKDAIRERDRLIYIAGPKAAISDYVREEWQFALESDKLVIPILRKGDFDVVPGQLCLIHTEDFRDDTLHPVQLAKLIANLKRDEPPMGKLFAVPNLPAHFLGRPDILRRIKDAVLIDLQKPVVHTSTTSRVGLQGMGGIGKSVLAAAVARDREIRRSYPDGVIWISFGQNLEDGQLAQLMRDVALHLGDPGLFENVVQGQGVLRNLLLDKAVLLVLDDVWRAKDAQVFDLLGPRCRALVTTRDVGILHTLHGEMYPIALFTEQEALSLLAAAVEQTPDQLPPAACDVVRECGCLPLAVALCGGMAKKRDIRWESILQRLRRADLEKIADRQAINEQHRSIYRAMQVSVEVLEPEEQKRFAELSVFVTDQTVPEAAVGTLWAQTGNLDDLDTEDLLINLRERALIRLDRDDATPDGKSVRRISLHDLLYDYAVRTAGDQQALNQTLLDAYRRKCSDGWPSGPDDGYFFRNLCHHLARANGNWDETVELLCDLRFVEARCRIGEVFDLIADYRLAQENLPEAQADLHEERAREKRAQRWTAEIIEYARQWSDRRDRLARCESVTEPEPKLPDPVSTCEMWSEEKIQAECLRIANQPTRFDRLNVFAGFVTTQCYPLIKHAQRPGFILQHAFNDMPMGPLHDAAAEWITVMTTPHIWRLWSNHAYYNPKPASLRTLEGHSHGIHFVSMTPDGRHAVSGSWDHTLRMWDLESGQCLWTLEGNSNNKGTSLSVTTDGRRAVLSGDDNTLGVWDLENRRCLRTLTGHRRPVTSVSVTPDGRRAVSRIVDETLRVWDLESGACLLTLEGHSSWVNSVSVTPDGWRAVLSGDDNTLGVWDLESGRCLRTLTGHSRYVTSVNVTPDGRRAVSGSDDKTLRVWDLESGRCLHTLEGHSDRVNSVSVTPDGRRVVSRE